MRTMTLWTGDSALKPWRALVDVQRNFDRLMDFSFGDSEGGYWSDQPIFHPAVEVDETDTHYLVNVDLPGVSRRDIGIEVKNGQLFISGERKSERRAKGASERFYGKFHRILPLPTGAVADKIEAQYEDGVLSVAMPKEEAVKPRRIKISDGRAGFFGRFLGRDAPEEKEARAVSAAVAS